MIDFSDNLVVVRGGGDLGSGVIWRLRRVGFPVIVLELERPLTVRRTVAFSSAVDVLSRIARTWTSHLAGSQPDDDALGLVIARG